MTFAPQTLLDVRDWLQAGWPQLSDNEVGIVGGPSHQDTGTSYHLGENELKMGKNPYSARTARDKAGLADPEIDDAACAIDLDDDWPLLREFSIWVVDQCRRPNPHPDTLDIREVIYTPDGKTVWTWDREKGQTSAPEQRGSSSHLTHTHLSRYRDATRNPLLPLFQRFMVERQGGDDVLEVPIPAGEGEKPAAPSKRVEMFQRALIRAGANLAGAGGPDGRFGATTKAEFVRIVGAAAGDGSLYDAEQRDILYSLAYGGPAGPPGAPGQPGPPGADGKTPTLVRLGETTAVVIEYQ